MKNCPNCSAPITGPRCEYCGTQLYPDMVTAGRIRMTPDALEILYADNRPVLSITPDGITCRRTWETLIGRGEE